MLFGECKYRNDFNEAEVLEGLQVKRSLARGREALWFYLFSGYAAHTGTRKRCAASDDVRIIMLDDLYR